MEDDTFQQVSQFRRYRKATRFCYGTNRSFAFQASLEPSHPFSDASFFFFFHFLPVYIDVDENNQPLTLDFQLPRRIQPRMWEIRIVQLAFEQRAPTGCLQYFQSPNGTLKTLNFLLNGRFLANQDYLMCIRQERGMCGIAYMPCSSDSFRIGPPRMRNTMNNTNVNASSIEGNSNMTNSAMQNSTNMISMNNTDSDIEGSGTNPMDDDGISGNATSMGQESASSSGMMGQQRCRDRVLIPCDFEEFITVFYLFHFNQWERMNCTNRHDLPP